MDDRDINNVHAWRMLQNGKATPADQKLAFEIHKAITHEEKRKTFSVSTDRNLTLELLIHREEIPRTKAYAIVAQLECVSIDVVRKDYKAWENQTPDERQMETERYNRAQSNFIDEKERKAKTARLISAIKQVTGNG
ncbi:hypothetical protein LG325_11935 [Marinobacter nauticus]